VDDVCRLPVLRCEGRVEGRLNNELICMAHKALGLRCRNWKSLFLDLSYIRVDRAGEPKTVITLMRTERRCESEHGMVRSNLKHAYCMQGSICMRPQSLPCRS
jgi:hypothetical protein